VTTQQLDIGEVIAATGLPASTLHLWERKGLITPVGRNGLRRQFDPQVLTTLAVIVLCQRTGFTLDEIGRFLDADADDDKQLLRAKLTELTHQRAQLDQAIEGIEHALACTYPDTIACPQFRENLENVFPTERSR